MKTRIVSLMLIILTSCLFAEQKGDYYQEALKESANPIRPGVPGERPFWNGHARQFIYAPAFDVKPVKDASKYRFTALYDGGKSYTFTADVPWAALTSIWEQMPVGKVELKIEAIDEQENVLKTAATRKFYRAAVFSGNYPEAPMDYKTSANVAIKALLNTAEVQAWLKTGKPDRDYELNRYPAKIYSAVITASAMYIKMNPDAADKDDMIKLGKNVADTLIELSEPAGAILEYFPPTYDLNIKVVRHMRPDWTMIPYAAEAGLAYLDFYDVTKDKKYFDAAIRIADTYKKTQMPNGTWYQLVELKTNKPAAQNLAVPTMIIRFLERLDKEYDVSAYTDVQNKAFGFIEQNSLKTYDWQGQYEDITPVKPYENQNKHETCDIAVYLLTNFASNPAKVAAAEELIRFGEDQFVIWDKPFPNIHKRDSDDSANWLTPCSLEQYRCYQPVTGSSAKMMHAYVKAYEVTKRPIYKAKAEALADAIITQQNNTGERYQTWLRKGLGHMWLNCETNVARAMLDLDRISK